MKYFRTFLIVGAFILGALFIIRTVSAQTPEDEAKRLGIKFPIAELGSCANVSACITYCDYPANHDSCSTFAKKQGFYKEHQSGKRDILAAAKKELGCDSETSCQAICEDPAQRQKCIDFAKSHGMENQTAGPPSDVIVSAKRELGCDSAESCMKYCESEANRAKCQSFASKHGFGSAPPPGGDYEKFCKENPDKCKPGRLSGPGGCSSQESCQKYCSEHPAECGGYQPPSEGSYSPPPGVYYSPYPGYSTPPPTSFYSPPPGSYTPPPEGSYSPPPNYTPPPDYTPPPNYSPSPEVQGVQTKNLLERIINFFISFFP